MISRTTTRICASLGTFLLVLGAFIAVTADDAVAVTYDPIVIGEGQEFEGEYGPILPANAAANVSSSFAVTTEICSTAPYCDVIPLEVQPPKSFTADDADYFVYVELTWPSVIVPDVPLTGDTSATDLDLFIVNDPFVETAGPDEDGFVYTSATQANPEKVTMFNPKGKFNLLIDNYASSPTNYTIRVAWSTIPLPSPFEKLPPEFSRTGQVTPSPVKPSLTASPTPSRTPAPVFQPAAPSAGVPDLAPSSPPVADASFEAGFGDGPGLDEQLAAPPASFDVEPVANEVRSAPPSALALALWLLALPLLLAAVGGWLLQRRQATAIEI